MEKIKVNDTCIGCGFCVKKEVLNIDESCPVGAIVVEEEITAEEN